MNVSRLSREVMERTLQQETYIPIIGQEGILNDPSLRYMVIATRASPNQPCGHAQRIGYLGDYTLYRLKVRYGPSKGEILTLSDVFMLVRRRFQPLPLEPFEG